MANRKIKKVMLMRPAHSISRDSVRRLLTPHSLLYMGAVLKDRGYEVEILDSVCEGYYDTKLEDSFVHYGLSDGVVAERISSFAPDIVGITSMFSSQKGYALRYADITKSVDEDVPVVVGGLHFSTFPREALKNHSVDYVVMGEGEYRFPGLIESLNKGQTDIDLDGIAYKRAGDTVVRPITARIADLDSLPFPARDLIDMERYISIGVPLGPFARRERVEHVLTSRGCPFHCIFCSAAEYFGREFRERSVDNIMAEVGELVSSYGIQEIQFSDDNLTLNRKRSKDLFRRLRGYGLSLCTPNGVMVQTLDEEMIELMAKAGLYQITFAIESGSERVLREIINKPIPDRREVKRLAAVCDGLGMQIHATFIVGFPGETREELNETLNYPYDMGFDSVSFFIASPIPGSKLHEQCKGNGYLKEGNRIDFKTSEIIIPEGSADFVMHNDELVKLVDEKTREYNEYSKRRNPERWNEKYSVYLKKNGPGSQIIMGRVT